MYFRLWIRKCSIKYNLIKFLKFKCVVSNQVSEIKNSSHIILPGVGAFGESIKNKKPITFKNFLEKKFCLKKNLFLGICVGMQVLAETGEEFKSHRSWMDKRQGY